MCKDSTGIKGIFCKYTEDRHALEMQGATVMGLIGIWLLFNDTFEVSAVYKIMAAIGTEKHWCIVFLSVAAVQLWSVFFEDVRFEWYFIKINALWVRKHILLIKGAIWFTLFTGVIGGDIRALSAPIYFIFAFNAFRSFFCVKYNVQKS